jgi:hypothetical protein
MSFKEKFSNIGMTLLGIGFLLLMLFIGSWLIKGMLWFTETAYPYLIVIGSFLFWIGVIVLLPLAFFKKTRGASGFGFLISASFYGILLWCTSLITIHMIWGWVGVVAGFLFAVIGIIPFSFIASIFSGSWDELGNLFLWLLITLGHGGLGLWLMSKSEKENSPVIDMD